MSKKPTTGYQRDYYEKVAPDRNERRREAYAKDPKARRENAERAKQWREGRASGATVDREFYRVLNGKRVRVYSTGQIADRLGISTTALRNWDAAGLLPAVLFEGRHRYYTAPQVREIEKLARERSKN